MRILQVLEATVGGTRKHLISILEYLDRTRFDVEVASPRVRHGGVADTQFVDEVLRLGVPWHRVEMRREISPYLDAKAAIQLFRLIRSRRYDIVHVHSSKAGFLGRVAAKLAGTRTVYTPNGLYFLDPDRPRARRLYQVIEQVAGLLTDRLIAVSQSEYDAAVEHRLTNRARLILIPNAIDTSSYIPDGQARGRVRKSLGISAETPVIGTVSRFIGQKDPATWVRAAQLIAARHEAVRFVWCGEGDLRGEIEQLARELGVFERISFLGFRQDVQDVMNAFDIFMLSSVFEGLPYTLLEVMALGIPAVATNVVGNRDVVVDGSNGRLVPGRDPEALASAALELLESPELRQQLGRQAQAHVRALYDVRVMVKNIESVYDSLAGEL